ncbi:putative protein N(5)-glutamine methyltransferase [Amycolatopsis tucumanensis]|uniref:peptide chain release factor N(5)-glutamine methyltransferase n=1 Tax=Amycolatopsis tucumanensis TaxID=401106 RepID=A0ABP7HL50_9PSEU|nr:putative protein N(5)-glutamine methyltransferase [Amycolatopsis tucumanensis]MCF6421043.1 putative protein N(5)-glutamine methyltransferase [Amycolatopsis tucumanensis]
MSVDVETVLVSRLRAAGCVFAEDEARLLLEAASGPAELDALTARRVAGEPLEQVLGWAGFRGLRIHVEPGVFVPRRRTELLVEEAVRLAPPHPVAVDLCCGSGALGAALAAELDLAELHAADLDPAAVRCARRNVPGEVHEGDLYEALPDGLRGRVDLLVVNVPYVPTDAVALMPPEARLHEPQLALDGGADGLDIARRVVAGAPEWLAPGGHLLIETSEQQAPLLSRAAAGAELAARVVTSDELDATAIVARRA